MLFYRKLTLLCKRIAIVRDHLNFLKNLQGPYLGNDFRFVYITINGWFPYIQTAIRSHKPDLSPHLN